MRVTDLEISAQLQVNPAWGIGIGILMIVLGVIAIAKPFFALFVSALLFSFIFIIASIVQSVSARLKRRDGHIAWKLIIGVLYYQTEKVSNCNPELFKNGQAHAL